MESWQLYENQAKNPNWEQMKPIQPFSLFTGMVPVQFPLLCFYNQMSQPPSFPYEGDTCPFCRMTFKNSAGLKQHLGKMHFVYDKVCECHVCSRKFKHKHALKFHIKQVHEKKTRVQCTACGKTLYNKYVLKNHMKKHHPTD